MVDIVSALNAAGVIVIKKWEGPGVRLRKSK